MEIHAEMIRAVMIYGADNVGINRFIATFELMPDGTARLIEKRVLEGKEDEIVLGAMQDAAEAMALGLKMETANEK
jgi:hypothetical protein